MADVQMAGSIKLYCSESLRFLPALPRPQLRILKIRFDWIDSVHFDYSVIGKCELCLGAAVRAEETHADEARVNVRCAEARLRPMGFQHMEHLFLYQRQFPLLSQPAIDRIWFRGFSVFEKETCGTYHPILFRSRPHGRFTRWRCGWARDSDDHTENDRIAFARR